VDLEYDEDHRLLTLRKFGAFYEAQGINDLWIVEIG
jgi:hypothetical protein